MKITKAILLIILFLSLFGCKEGFLESTIKDINGGTYHVYGIKIDKRHCFASTTCETGEVISADTTEIEMGIGIEYLSGRTDSIWVWGLELAGTLKGRIPTKIEGTNLTFDTNRTGHLYVGTGRLGGGVLDLNTEYRYRSITIEYHLQGEKTDDELERYFDDD